MTTGSGSPPAEADLIATAVAGCAGVAALSGEVATYLPGRRVVGVRAGAENVEVHVVARYPVTVAELTDQIRAAVAPLVGTRSLLVRVDDLDVDRDVDLDLDVDLDADGVPEPWST